LEKNTEITGNFYVSKGTEYYFNVFSGSDLTMTADVSYDITINPVDTSTYTTHTVSGQIFLSNGVTEIEDSSVNISIFTENGGSKDFPNAEYTKGTGYSIVTETFGSSCVLFIEVNDHVNPAYSYYIDDIDLSASIVTLDLTKPSTGFSTVSVTGVVNSMFTGTMIYSDSISFDQILNYSLPGITNRDVQIYNPYSKSFFWTTSLTLSDAPGAGDSTIKLSVTTPSVPGSAVTLAVPSLAGPTEAVLGTSIVYSTGSLSFAGSADMYMVTLMPNEVGEISGNVMSSMVSYDLPDDIVTILTSTSDSYTSWDANIIPMNYSYSFDFNAFINFQGFSSGFEMVVIMGASSMSIDLIL